MILPLLAAATAAAAIPPPAGWTPRAHAEPRCEEIVRRVAEHQREVFKPLGRLPGAYAEYAVMRQVDRCLVPAPVGYHPPALPGAADAPAKREDAPSNRR